MEVSVQIVERWVLARLRNRRFFSLAELNQAIHERLEDLNGRETKHLGASRRKLFEALDRPALKPLPAQPYQYAEWKQRRASLDYHVEIAKHYYSVPHTRANLLILDDWGPDRLNPDQRRDLMEIVEDRYNNAAILVTSQLPLAKWHDVIGEPTFADAILDRIVHNAHRIDLVGPSMRKAIAENINANAIDHTEQK